MCRIFISAAGEDKVIAAQMCNELEHLYGEKEIFFYKRRWDIRKKWPEKVNRALANSLVILLIGTKNCNKDKIEIINEICQYPDKVIVLNYGGFDERELPESLHGREAFVFEDNPFALCQLDQELSKHFKALAIARFLKNMDEDRKFFRSEDISTCENTLDFEMSLRYGYFTEIRNYEEFITHLISELKESSKSIHTMSVTRESIRNFYLDQRDKRGEKWMLAQRAWSTEHSKDSIKRIAIVDPFERYDVDFKKILVGLLETLDDICDLKIYELDKMKSIPMDLGVFYRDDRPFTALFTFVSVLSGQNFTKLASNEYLTDNSQILLRFEKYFNDLWSNRRLKLTSDAFKNMWLKRLVCK